MTVPQPTDRDERLARELEDLAEAVSALRAELRELRTSPLPREEVAGWEDERPPAAHDWIPTLAPPRRVGGRVPRLPLELAFLAGVAALAGLADLRPVEIGVAMAVAWIVVAFAEWAGSRADRLRAQLQLAPPYAGLDAASVPAHPDPAWFTPPTERTLLGAPDEQATAISSLPPAGGERTLTPAEDPETTAEHRPAG